MPTNKNASIRYQALDKCFSDRHRRYYFNDLMKKCDEALLRFNGVGGVSRRQIFEDIKYMESEAGWNIPLLRVREGKRTFYQYADEHFTINRQPLTKEEAAQLDAVITMLGRFHGILNCEWIDEIISNLEWRFNLKHHEQPILCFDQNLQLKGVEFLSLILNATLQKQVLEVVYCSYKKGACEQVQRVHPYYVKQYNNRWFLMALDEESQRVCNLALDRIRHIETVAGAAFIPNTDIDFDHYFDDVIGVTVPDEETEKLHIVLQLEATQFAYVTAKPLHPSQGIVDEERKIISIDVKPNYELDYHLLAICPFVEVLAPQSYRNHMQEMLKKSLERYQ